MTLTGRLEAEEVLKKELKKHKDFWEDSRKFDYFLDTLSAIGIGFAVNAFVDPSLNHLSDPAVLLITYAGIPRAFLEFYEQASKPHLVYTTRNKAN